MTRSLHPDSLDREAQTTRLSQLHASPEQRSTLEDLTWKARAWDGEQAYFDTKLHDVLLAFGIARRWSGVLSNALERGWIPTKMGGTEATDDLDEARRTQVWACCKRST